MGSVLRRAPGFDVPEFLAAGPREVLVAASDLPAAREVLREVDPGEPEPASRSGADRPPRLVAWLLIAVALVGLFICVVAYVLV